MVSTIISAVLRALRECTFTIEQGRITCLVGPNGAGKTTIFNVITGFLKPDEGSVAFRGRKLDGLRPQAIVHAGIARTFQNLRLFTDLTALDNVMVGIGSQFGEEPIGAIFRPLHTARAQTQRRETALATLEHVGLADRAHDLVRNLSYGEQKLLTVARVLATGAELLLLDEPASGLSAGALDAVMALLRRLQSEGKTLLVVEHNTRVVQQIADDVLFLHQGHLMAQGTPEHIISDPALAEIYFGGATVMLQLVWARRGLRREDGYLRCVVRAGAGTDPGVPRPQRCRKNHDAENGDGPAAAARRQAGVRRPTHRPVGRVAIASPWGCGCCPKAAAFSPT